MLTEEKWTSLYWTAKPSNCSPKAYPPPPLVTGDDLVAAGMVPGPAFKAILEKVYDAQLGGEIRTTEGAGIGGQIGQPVHRLPACVFKITGWKPVPLYTPLRL